MRDCQALPTNDEARRWVFVEFTAFPWIETWQGSCNYIDSLGEDFENGEAIGSRLSIQRADLEWMKRRMSRNNGIQKRSEKGLLTPDNRVVALIDHQP